MNISHFTYHRMLLLSASVIFILSIVLILGVIPAVKAEFLRGGTPEQAVIAFWVTIGLNIISAIILISVATKSKRRNWISTSVTVISGFIVLLLGLTLADAASAYIDHGPEMKIASILLFICAVFDFLAGCTAIIAASLRPKELKQA